MEYHTLVLAGAGAAILSRWCWLVLVRRSYHAGAGWCASLLAILSLIAQQNIGGEAA